MNMETDLTETAEITATADDDETTAAAEAFWAAVLAARARRPAQDVREAIGRRGVRCHVVFTFRGYNFALPIAKTDARWLLSGLARYAVVWVAEVDDGEIDGVYLFADN